MVRVLSASTASGEDLGAALARAADDRIRALADDRGLAYLFWLLTRVTWHARSRAFYQALSNDGVAVPSTAAGLAFVAHVGSVAAEGVRERGESSALADLAIQAFKETLARAVHDRARTLFGIGERDVQRSLRELSKAPNFGALSRDFFGGLLANVFQFLASKETPQQVGARFRTSTDAAAFETTTAQYAFQSARVLEQYAAEWYSKHNWLRDITEESAHRFVSYAMTKLLTEMGVERSR